MSAPVSHGRPEPLGLTIDATGANVAVVSEHADAVELCLFDAAGAERRIPLPGRTGHVRHGHVQGIRAGDAYGLRADGPYAPQDGHRFNPAKLLLDPYATHLSGPVRTHPAMHDADPTDTAALMPRCLAAAPLAPVDPAERPRTPWPRTVIYEAHVKGLTRLWPGMDPAIAGTVEALAEPAVIAHLVRLGITALELMPLTAIADERHLGALGLGNYWGYNPASLIAPEPRYLGPNGISGLRETVRRLHGAGIEVILDVVLNHTAEGDGAGPTLSLRGLDNARYYARNGLCGGVNDGADGGGAGDGYANETGCGNRLDMADPAALRLAMDALRWWAGRIGIDGFRFDLAPALLRGPGGFAPGSGFLATLLQDPELRGLKLIAEPWDIGEGGHRLGRFPAPVAEWNDRMRDHIRSFWRGDAGAARGLADGLLGSAQAFDRAGRAPWASINFVACHDGFTVADLTMYAARRNHTNGEDNRDGHGHNLSDPMGPEGPSDDPAQTRARRARQRALIATALLAQGTPMLRAGDEIGQSQGGNNNAYCQDNATTWIDWTAADAADRAQPAFVARVLALRAACPALRQPVFLHARTRPDGLPEVAWSAPDGSAPDWEGDGPGALTLLLRGAAGAEDDPDPVLLALNRTDRAVPLALPPEPGRVWRCRLDTAEPDALPGGASAGQPVLAPGSLAVFVAEDRP